MRSVEYVKEGAFCFFCLNIIHHVFHFHFTSFIKDERRRKKNEKERKKNGKRRRGEGLVSKGNIWGERANRRCPHHLRAGGGG